MLKMRDRCANLRDVVSVEESVRSQNIEMIRGGFQWTLSRVFLR